MRDLRESHHRIALTHRQIDEEGRDLADRLTRARRQLGIGIDRRRRHCADHGAGHHGLAAGEQPVAQRTGDHRQHDVVDIAVVAGVDRPEVGQCRRRDGEPPVPRHGGVERAVGRAAAHHGAGRFGHPAAQLQQLAAVGHRRPQGAELLAGPGQPVGHRVQHQPTGRRLTLGQPDVVDHTHRLAVAVGDHVTDLHRPHAIDDHLMGLDEQRQPITAEPLDQIHLPQRAGAVQRAARQPGDEVVQLGIAARRRQRRAPDVVGDVEVGVVDPHRPGQPEGDLAHLLAIARCLREVAFHGLQQSLVAQPAARPTQDRQRAGVHRRRGVLLLVERGIGIRQTCHHRRRASSLTPSA